MKNLREGLLWCLNVLDCFDMDGKHEFIYVIIGNKLIYKNGRYMDDFAFDGAINVDVLKRMLESLGCSLKIEYEIK